MSYKAFKFRLYPTKNQEQMFLATVGSCRFVYNKLLEINLEYYRTVGTTGIACEEHIRLIESKDSLAMFNEAGINSLMKETIHSLG